MIAISDEAYEQLRQILEKQHKRAYSFEEAKEVGDELLEFYMLLINVENRLRINKTKTD